MSKKAASEKKTDKIDNKEIENSDMEETKAHIQPEINIGLIGHVDHGKTTLTEKLSGKWTDTHSEEIRRGITIRLGYADVDIYQDENGKFNATKQGRLIRRISLVDAPGHESLMATMLAGATIIDGALLLVAANEPCPQPQTREHVKALEIIGIKNIIVVQNKIDLLAKEDALKNYAQIKEFLKETPYKNAPVIPISAQQGINIDILLKEIQETIPTPKRSKSLDPIMFIARSFDINKPGTKVSDMKGGVLGGSLQQGELKAGDEIEIVPGYQVEEKNKKVSKSIYAKIVSIMTGGESVEKVVPGGSIAILTTLEPSIVKSDKLTGNVVGYKGKVPPTRYELSLETHLLERVVGVEENTKVDPIKRGEPLMLNVNAAATVGLVTDLSKKTIKCNLKLPVACYENARITISRRIGNRFRLIGYGTIKKNK